MDEKFADRDRGGAFFTGKDAPGLLVRQKTASDSPLPSGNGVAAMVLLSLGRETEAQRTLEVFARQLRDQAEGMSTMVQAALLFLSRHEPFTVEAAPQAQRPLSPQQIAAGVVEMRTEWIDTGQLAVHLSIMEGFHIQAHDAGEGLIATTLAVSGNEVPATEVIDYPPGDEQRFAFADQALRVYSGQVTIAVRFAADPPPGGVVDLAITYQACDEKPCW